MIKNATVAKSATVQDEGNKEVKIITWMLLIQQRLMAKPKLNCISNTTNSGYCFI